MGSKSGFSEPSPTQEHLTVAQVLRAAADLIEPRGRWSQGTFARTESGLPIPAVDAGAACWCAYGAIARVSNGLHCTSGEAASYLKMAAGRLIAPWNDDPKRTQAQVVAAFRSAADLAEAGVGRLGNQDNATTGQAK